MAHSQDTRSSAPRLTPPPRSVAVADWWCRLYQVNTQPVSIMDESWWATDLPASLKTWIVDQPRGQRAMSRLLLAHVPGLNDFCWDFDLPLRRLLLLPPDVFQNLLRWAGAAAQAERLRTLVQRHERQAWIAVLGADTFEDVVRQVPLRLGARFTGRLERALTLPNEPLERTVRLGVACLGVAWTHDPVLAPRARWLCPRQWAPWFDQPCLFTASEALSLVRKLLPESAPAWLPWFD